jgi:flagellar hook protein FlgE
MSFYTSLSGLKAAQLDLSAISNNIANVGSIGFKKSRAEFGDLFSSAPTQTTKMVAGQGTHLNGLTQQFSQGTLEGTDKTLDLGISGEGFFVVEGAAPRKGITYTRDGAFAVDANNNVVDTTGSKLKLLPVDANGTVTSTAFADMTNFVLPTSSPTNASAALSNVSMGPIKSSVKSPWQASPQSKDFGPWATPTGSQPATVVRPTSAARARVRSGRSARARSNAPTSMSPKSLLR